MESSTGSLNLPSSSVCSIIVEPALIVTTLESDALAVRAENGLASLSHWPLVPASLSNSRDVRPLFDQSMSFSTACGLDMISSNGFHRLVQRATGVWQANHPSTCLSESQLPPFNA
jgi:hypothetical protein